MDFPLGDNGNILKLVLLVAQLWKYANKPTKLLYMDEFYDVKYELFFKTSLSKLTFGSDDGDFMYIDVCI